MKVARRRHREPGMVDERYVLLRYANGNVADPRTCKIGNLAPSHWMRIDDLPSGQPNMACLCPKDEQS